MIDLWIPRIGVVIELKYRTRKFKYDQQGESFVLRDQAKKPQGRYDFLKDIRREELVSRRQSDIHVGFAISLTYDAAYWRTASRAPTVDATFGRYASATAHGISLVARVPWWCASSSTVLGGRLDRRRAKKETGLSVQPGR